MKNRFTNPRIVGAYRQKVSRSIVINDAPYRRLIVRLNKRIKYTVGGEEFDSVRGDAVFIPKGASYTTHQSGEANEFLVVRFLSDDDGEWEIMHVDDLAEAIAVHTDMSRALVFDDRKSHMRALSHFYKLLSIISEGAAGEQYLPERKLALIRPALDHLEESIFSPELEIGKLSRLCGISEVYFRRIFKSYTGMQPQKYVMTKRLERARGILTDDPSIAITAVAEAVGYSDPLYFSRIYKRCFGIPPSETAREEQI